MLYNIVFSPTGGTKKVSEIISKELSNNIKFIDLTLTNNEFLNYQLTEEDIAVISMPSFAGRAPQVAIERLKNIKANKTKAILVCVYGNRDYEDTLVEMQDIAKDIGFNTIAAISAVAEHSIARLYAANRPDNKDIEQLKDFANKIKTRITSSENSNIIISGNRPYKNINKVGLIPKTRKCCIRCKRCAELCPTEAISKTDVKKIDKNKCISCMRCISICPKKAKTIGIIKTGIISLVLKKVCSERRENELY